MAMSEPKQFDPRLHNAGGFWQKVYAAAVSSAETGMDWPDVHDMAVKMADSAMAAYAERALWPQDKSND